MNLTVAHIERHVFPGWVPAAGSGVTHGDFGGEFLPRSVDVRDVRWSASASCGAEWDLCALAVRHKLAERVDCNAVYGEFLSVLGRCGWREHGHLAHLCEPLAVRHLLLSKDIFYGRLLYRLFYDSW